MSNWDQYCNQLTGSGLQHALIISIDDGSVWGKSTDCPVPKPEDTASIARRAKGTAPEAEKQAQIMFLGVKYFFLRADEDIIQGKQGQGGVLIAACAKCVVVAAYNDKIVPGEANKHVINIQEHLKNANF